MRQGGTPGRGVVAFGVAAVVLAGCSSTPEVQLPDLAGLGLAPAACEDTVQMSGIVAEEPGSEVECWTGAPVTGYLVVADGILDLVLDETAGEDVSGALCWEDTLTDTEGSACRAALIGGTDDGLVVSAVVALADPEAVTAGLGDAPTDEDVAAAISGADLEVLVFSEPAAVETQG